MCITEFLYNVAEGQIASCEIDNEPCAATRNSPDAAELGRVLLQVNLQLNNERNGKYENAKKQRGKDAKVNLICQRLKRN